MAIGDINSVDFGLLVADLIVLGLATAKYYTMGNSFGKCRHIEITQKNLNIWRFFLYTSVYATWIASLLLFIFPSNFRHLIHPYFITGVLYMMYISIPAYICKTNGYGGTCNCDFYEYDDFVPMIILAIIGHGLFIFLELSQFTGSILFVGLFVSSFFISKLIPKKELQPLKYPEYLLISEIDQLQEYLMTNPHEKKLLTVVDAKCDFCEIQVQEIMRSSAFDGKQLRIFDLTITEKIDPIIPMTLNLDMDQKIPVPTTFIFDSGMAIEQKDGVLSKQEIEAILMS